MLEVGAWWIFGGKDSYFLPAALFVLCTFICLRRSIAASAAFNCPSGVQLPFGRSFAFGVHS